MKKRTLIFISVILYVIFALFASKAKAQNIGINITGATPNASAGLDVDFTNKGLLIPRIALTSTASASPLTSPATSVLVYNTATAGSGATAVNPGYYYWSGTTWIQFQTNGGSGSIWSRSSGNIFPSTIGDNLGIGTSSPAEKLHVFGGNIALDDNFHLRNAAGKNTIGSTPYAIEIGDATASRSIDLMIPASYAVTFNTPASSNVGIYNSNGQLGLGTMSPTERLFVSGGNIALDDNYHIKSTLGNNMIGSTLYTLEIGDNTFNKSIDFMITPNYGINFNTPLFSNTGAFNSYGQLGLGTNNPTERLEVVGGNIAMDDSYHLKNRAGKNTIGTTVYTIDIGDNTASRSIDLLISSGYGVDFVTPSSSNAAQFTSLGQLGLGTMSPSERLDVNGNIQFSGTLLPGGSAGTTGQVLVSNGSASSPTWQTPASASSTAWALVGNTGTTAGTNFIGTTDAKDLVFKTSNTERMRMLSTGNIGIGITAPAYKLDVFGSIRTGSAGLDGQIVMYSEQGATDWTYIVNPNGAATQNVTLTLPPDDGTANQVLTTDGTGNLTWTTTTAANAWNTIGNTGTSAATNFIGTTDNVNLMFRVNNQQAGRIENTTTNNTAFGINSGTSISTGVDNTFIGSASGTGTTTANGNTGIGKYALNSSSGNNNTAVGFWSMKSNSSGMYNAAIGGYSLNDNTSGNRNAAMGYSALQNNTIGTDNATLGYAALAYNISGNYNVAAGDFAGVTSTFANANTLGSYNVFIGSYSGPGVASASALTNAIAIGKNALVNTSNTMVLGGTGTDAVNVGIGTASPGERLAVVGSESTAHGKSACISLTNTAAGSGNNWYLRAGATGTSTPAAGFSIADNFGYRLNIDGSGNVGIGTTIPGAVLDVNGTTRIGSLGTVLTNIIKSTNNVDVTSISANTSAITNFTVTNAVVGSTVSISPNAALANGLLIAYARVSAANTVEVKFTNITGSAIDPALMDYYITVVK